LSPDAVRYERDGAYGPEWSVVCGANQGFKPYLWKWGSEGRTELDRLKRFASIWAQKKINEAIGDADNGTGTSVRVLLNDVKDGMAIHIVPDTLLGAMWLQCARVLTENPTFKACENCGKWFELSPDARRKNSKYCSDRCKVAAHRARAIIPTKCESCDARFTINVAPSSGFSYMNHQDVTCPKCGAVSHRLLPGEFIGVTVRGKRQMVKAHT
jgi:hypothetical protein